jgi:hypothetical protein
MICKIHLVGVVVYVVKNINKTQDVVIDIYQITKIIQFIDRIVNANDMEKISN